LGDPFRRPYLDAQSWITALSGEGPYAADLAEWLAAADRAELQIVTSVLMPVEVLGGPHDARTQASAERAEQAMRRSSVQQVNVTRIIVADARRLRIDHGLKTVDAIHVATSAFGRADVLLTNDDKVQGLGEFKGVPIRRPDWQGDLPFDFGSAD
jgi:predicted nucleic acid-binding protein